MCPFVREREALLAPETFRAFPDVMRRDGKGHSPDRGHSAVWGWLAWEDSSFALVFSPPGCRDSLQRPRGDAGCCRGLLAAVGDATRRGKKLLLAESC